jgi:hypothetical protein
LPILPRTILLNTLYFGLILILVKIIPRFFDTYVQSHYPMILLIIEIINGSNWKYCYRLCHCYTRLDLVAETLHKKIQYSNKNYIIKIIIIFIKHIAISEQLPTFQNHWLLIGDSY